MPALRADALNQRVLSGGRVENLGGLSKRVALVEEDQAGRSDDRANQVTCPHFLYQCL